MMDVPSSPSAPLCGPHLLHAVVVGVAVHVGAAHTLAFLTLVALIAA